MAKDNAESPSGEGSSSGKVGVNADGPLARIENFLKAHEAKLRGYYRFLLGKHGLQTERDSHDILSSVLVEIVENAEDLDLNTDSQFVAFCRKAGHNKVIDKVRRNNAGKRNAGQPIQPLNEEMPSKEALSPSKIFHVTEIYIAIGALLSHEDEEIAILRAQGFQFDEIAERRNLSTPTVQRRLAKAFARIAKMLNHRFDLSLAAETWSKLFGDIYLVQQRGIE
jgi:RNA polymerase sigma factor (sigma-70 family)